MQHLSHSWITTAPPRVRSVRGPQAADSSNGFNPLPAGGDESVGLWLVPAAELDLG